MAGKNNKAKRKLIDWGIVQFVMTEVGHSKEYDIAIKRAYDLLNSEKLNKLQISRLQGVLTYLDRINKRFPYIG
ncbi:hypothetical protein [Treponema pedis]|uniref:hypothetical protein n=1 Tax=Treponema pedis TaxID=409322 RepID=UPI0003FE75B0|nr:hypothetical protein [Treponema pedis]